MPVQAINPPNQVVSIAQKHLQDQQPLQTIQNHTQLWQIYPQVRGFNQYPQNHQNPQKHQSHPNLKPRLNQSNQRKINLVAQLNVHLFPQSQHFWPQQNLLQCPQHLQTQRISRSQHVYQATPRYAQVLPKVKPQNLAHLTAKNHRRGPDKSTESTQQLRTNQLQPFQDFEPAKSLWIFTQSIWFNDEPAKGHNERFDFEADSEQENHYFMFPEILGKPSKRNCRKNVQCGTQLSAHFHSHQQHQAMKV